MSNWDRAFALGTACYVAAFSACVYAHTASAVAKMGVSLLASALPALLATELCGGDEAGGGELARTWLQEFVGTAVMVALTCCPGAAVGHLGRAYEYGAHWVAMVAADYSCGGPQVNPVITVAMLVARGGSAVEALVRIMAQVGGGVVGWRLLFGGERFLTGAVGGPAPDAHLPLFYVFWSECLGACALALAVFAFATTKFFQEGDNYLAKMACINVVLRCVILGHGATGPAVNPALASSYAFAASGAWPPLEDGSPHYVAFWAGGLCGAALAGSAWRAITKFAGGDCGPKFPNEAAKLALGAYGAGLALVAWRAHLGVEAAAIIHETKYGMALKARHPLTKLFGRKPRGY